MSAQRRPVWGRRLALRLTGAALLVATATIHLDLYLTGYRTIPTIGPLFLMQVIAAFALAALVLAIDSRLVEAAGAGFALSTLGGYLLSMQFGLFGFREVRTTAGVVAGIVEVVAFAALAYLAATPTAAVRTSAARPAVSVSPARPAFSLSPARPAFSVSPALAVLATAAVSVIALGLLGGALANAGNPGGSAGGSAAGSSASASVPNGDLHTRAIGGMTVLVNASGRTLYWFAPDTSRKSACTGSCAAYWPPVRGPVKAGPGVTGKLGTIKRSDGSLQATYDGHPLYTYVGDSGPGQDHGNNLNLNGGLWHVVAVAA